MDTYIQIFGILAIITGFLSLFPSFIKVFIRFGNILEGDKTHITKGTILWFQIGGVVAIIAGLAILFGVFS